MIVETLALLTDNYGYLVVCEQTGKAAVVDPSEADPVLDAVAARGVELVAVWCTHHHFDHTAGNEELARKLSLEIYGHRGDAGRLSGLTHGLDDGATVSLGALQARVLHTPGHTRGGLVYLVGGAAFTGDALFAAGCGRLFEGDPPTLYRSLNERIATLPPETRIYCGHEYTLKNLAFALSVEPGNAETTRRRAQMAALRKQGTATVPFTLAEELATNPFLRCKSAEIRASLEGRFPAENLADPVKVFARLRQLRDRF